MHLNFLVFRWQLGNKNKTLNSSPYNEGLWFLYNLEIKHGIGVKLKRKKLTVTYLPLKILNMDKFREILFGKISKLIKLGS